MNYLRYTDQMKSLRDMRPGDLEIDVIADSLAKQCRFNGRTPGFYSVAQHCCSVSRAVGGEDPAVRLWGLLHDAAEAWIGDVPRPLKERLMYHARGTGDLIDLAAIEQHILKQVARRFDLPWPVPRAVVEADNRELAREVATFWPEVDTAAELGVEPPRPGGKLIPVTPWLTWRIAKREFWRCFERWQQRRANP